MKLKFKGRAAAVAEELAKMAHSRKLLDTVVSRLAKATSLKESGTIVQEVYEATRSSWNDPTDHEVACKKGCAYCCHLNVDVIHGEEVVIRDYVRSIFSKSQINEIKDRAMIRYRHTENLEVEQRQDIKGACAFLSDENTCMIYDVRPISCRGFYSVMLERCEEGFERAGVKNAFWADPMKAKEDVELGVSLIELSKNKLKMPRSIEQFIMKKL